MTPENPSTDPSPHSMEQAKIYSELELPDLPEGTNEAPPLSPEEQEEMDALFGADSEQHAEPEPAELSPEEAAFERQRAAKFAEVRTIIAESEASTLLKGKLPPELEAKVDAPYALGFNQSMAGTLAEAEDYLHKSGGGVTLEHYAPRQRFRLIDGQFATEAPDVTEQIVVAGHYGDPEIGRFVYAFPVADADPQISLATAAAEDANLPPDFLLERTDSQGRPDEIANPKYCAGFIDRSGHFFPNTSFMEKSAFTTVKA